MATYLAGTSGRVKAIAVTPVLTTDTVTFAGSTATIASITQWELSVSGQPTKSLTLESGADAQGRLYADLLRGGVTEWSFSVQGQFDASPATPSTFGEGVFAVCDFLLKKATAAGVIGYVSCNGMFHDFRITGVNTTSNAAVMFSATFSGSGVLPALTVT